MRKIILLILTALFLTSCPIENAEIFNLMTKKDREAPVLMSFELKENKLCIFLFNEIVSIVDARIGSKDVIRPTTEAKMVILEFREPLSPGQEELLLFSAKDRAGNTSRYALRLTGVNLNQADLLITEVSMKGTDQNPDRIELTAMSDGSALGFVLMDGIIGYENHRYYIPDLDLRKNDIIVIYWDRCESLPNTLIRDTETTYYLYAESPETLIGTNGAVVLYNHANGKGEVEDAFLYNTGDSVNNNGYGNKTSEESVKYLSEIEEWYGSTFKSVQITSSRVAARYYPYEDTNTESDFYITAARNSTFGYPNTNVIYEP